MKGIAHFATGLCLASFVPGVVDASADGSLLIALGGACGMLPDTLDFRLARFLPRHHADIMPGTSDAADSARDLAHATAAQIRLTTPGRPRNVQLHPRRHSAASWLTYSLRFEPGAPEGDVVVTVNGAEGRGWAGVAGDPYGGRYEIGQLGGPMFGFSRDPAGSLRIEFLPWHRIWSHSLLIALALGIGFGVCAGTQAGVVAALGFTGPVLEDQLGRMGSNLFWPLTRQRSMGLDLMHSGDVLPNLLTVWAALALILFNLDRARPAPALDALQWLLPGIVLPALVLLALAAVRRHDAQRTAAPRPET